MSDTQTSAPAVTTEAGDHDLYSHYVIGGYEAILRSMVTGVPCEALCGKVWVPHRDPKKFPLCPTCAAIKAEATNA